MENFVRGLDPKESLRIGFTRYSKTILEIIEKSIGDEHEITLDSNLKDDLGIDSLDAVEILIEIEKEYNIEISDEEAYKVRTVSDIIKYLISKNVLK